MLRLQEIKEKKLLLKNFIKNPKLTANFLPSSRFLVKEILANINFKEASYNIEYGPYNGSLTKHNLRKSNKNTKLLCFDINTEFCNYLKKNIKDQRLIVINDDAANVKKYLKKYNINHVDYIISGIPFSFIPPKIKNDTGGIKLVIVIFSFLKPEYAKCF